MFIYLSIGHAVNRPLSLAYWAINLLAERAWLHVCLVSLCTARFPENLTAAPLLPRFISFVVPLVSALYTCVLASPGVALNAHSIFFAIKACSSSSSR